MMTGAKRSEPPGSDRAELAGRKVHRVRSIRHLTDSAFVLRVDRHNLPGVAGQCATLGVAGSGLNREYSLCSGDNDSFSEFLIKEVEGGQGVNGDYLFTEVFF